MRVMVTGATGFVGKRFVEFNQDKYQLIPVSLRNSKLENLDLSGVDVIVHLAGKAHDMKKADDQVYFEVNYQLTRNLANIAKTNAIPHFIFISTVKVYGDESKTMLNEISPCFPEDAYGKSKWKAEEYLKSLQSEQFRIAIIRPPLVYGPGVKGNMIRILRLADKNIPLPFAKAGNERSMVFVDNLVALINRIIDKKAAGVFIAGDARPLSTDELVRMLRIALDRKANMLSIPGFIRNIIKHLEPSLFRRLFGSFVIDNTRTNAALDFQPPFSSEFGIQQMVNWYKQQTA